MNRGWLGPLVPVYSAAAHLKNEAYDRGWLGERRLRWPVISVGNLSVGGAGKTPVVIRLAELLGERGIAVSVLSRGYGRDSSATELVDPGGTAARFGDEPLMMARRLPGGRNGNHAGARAFVAVGADRYAAGLLLERSAASWDGTGDTANPDRLPRAIHLLDDGFQHRRLARNVDVVVLHRSDFDERLLPVGRLREPLTSLSRASVLVLREEDDDLEGQLRRRGLKVPIWRVRRSFSVPHSDANGLVAFCGIARPSEFFEGLRDAGKTVLHERTFGDHHRYSLADLDALYQLAIDSGADGFVTTEKDAVRLDAELFARLTSAASAPSAPGAVRNIPLLTAGLTASFCDEVAVTDQLLRMIASG